MANIQDRESYVSFKLGSEYFGIHVQKVLEVLQNEEINKVPESPENILGVINFRGSIVPVIDMNKKFNLKRAANAKEVVIVLELQLPDKKALLGIRVDLVVDVNTFYLKDIKNPPDVGFSYNPEFLEGMVKTDDGFIMLLYADKLFTSNDVFEMGSVAEGISQLIQEKNNK